MRHTAVALCLLALALAGCHKAPPPSPPPQPAPQRQPATKEKPAEPAPMTREEFKRAVLGKTPDEVLKLLGRPDRTNEVGASTFWKYHHRTRDEITGKIDSVTTVTFQEGVVDSVDF